MAAWLLLQKKFDLTCFSEGNRAYFLAQLNTLTLKQYHLQNIYVVSLQILIMIEHRQLLIDQFGKIITLSRLPVGISTLLHPLLLVRNKYKRNFV